MRRFRIACAGVIVLVGAGAAFAPTAQALPVVGTVSVCVTINETGVNVDVNGTPVEHSVSQPTTCIVVP